MTESYENMNLPPGAAIRRWEWQQDQQRADERTALEAAKKDEEEECPECKDIRENHGGYGPSHNGSHHCESGSIASGGRRAHCTCNCCF